MTNENLPRVPDPMRGRFGKRIRRLEDVRSAMVARKSLLYMTGHGRDVRPAAWIIQQSGERILSLIQTGLYIYRPKGTKSRYGKLLEVVKP